MTKKPSPDLLRKYIFSGFVAIIIGFLIHFFVISVPYSNNQSIKITQAYIKIIGMGVGNGFKVGGITLIFLSTIALIYRKLNNHA